MELRRGIKYVVVCIFLVFSLALAGCASGPSGPSESLTVAIESTPTNLDPRLATDAASLHLNQLLYNGLFKWNERAELEPDLAKSVNQEGESTFLITLKPGIRFHHGKELTAQDVKFTLESILDPSLKSPNYSSLEMLARVEVLDKYRLRLLLKEAFSPFLAGLTIGILPEDLGRQPGYSFSRQPVGTGPFKLAGRPSAEVFVLNAHNEHFQGPPRLKELKIKVVPDDTVRVMELMNGATDLIINAIAPDAIPLLQKDGRLRVEMRPGTNYSYLGFNLNDPILNNREVRAAIAHAIDREGIIRYLLKGTATLATGVLSPKNWAYEGGVQTYSYSPGKARALLDAAGYPVPPGGGARFKLVYKTTQNELRRLIGEALMAQLKEVGIEVTMRTYEWGTFFSDIKSGNFQLYTLTWVGITEPDIMYYIFHSESMPPGGANRGRYSNPVVDRILTEARSTPFNWVRKQKYRWVQRILAQDLPYVSLWYNTNVAAMRKDVKGFHLTSAGDFTPLAKVWVERSGKAD